MTTLAPAGADVIGYFDVVDGADGFEYVRADVSPFPGYDHMIYVGVDETRYCRVLKTRAHVVVDEGADGEPVVETWLFRRHLRRAT